MKNLMIKILLAVILVMTFASTVDAVMSPNTTRFIAILDDYEVHKVNTIEVIDVSLIISGEKYYSKFAPNCRFYDQKSNQISINEFLSKYLKRYVEITVLDIPRGTMITRCKVR